MLLKLFILSTTITAGAWNLLSIYDGTRIHILFDYYLHLVQTRVLKAWKLYVCHLHLYQQKCIPEINLINHVNVQA